jgi:hypothetical protein
MPSDIGATPGTWSTGDCSLRAALVAQPAASGLPQAGRWMTAHGKAGRCRSSSLARVSMTLNWTRLLPKPVVLAQRGRGLGRCPLGGRRRCQGS